MKIDQFLKAAKEYGAIPDMKSVEGYSNIMFGAFISPLTYRYVDTQKMIGSLALFDNYHESALFQISYTHIESCGKSKGSENMMCRMHASFVQGGFNKILSGTSYMEGSKVKNYARPGDGYFEESTSKEGFLAITFFPATEKVAVNVIPNNPLFASVLKTYRLDRSEIQKANIPFFFVTTHNAPVPPAHEKLPFLKGAIIL